MKLSNETGISRVAVWKHINTLKREGFSIQSHSKGYSIPFPDDLLLPFCFEPHIEKFIVHFQEVTSTMDIAKDFAMKEAPQVTCVVAEKQTKSRGRLNRKWISDRGGLWITLLLRPEMPSHMAWIYNFVASSAMCNVLSKLYNLDVRIKWPNDLMLKNKKLAGLLSEMETQSDAVKFLLIGIGLNINNKLQSQDIPAISLGSVVNECLPRKTILQNFLLEFRTMIKDMEPSQVISDWKTKTSTIGSRVRVETYNNIFNGIAKDVDNTGALIIEDDDHKPHKIIYGDCFHIQGKNL